MIVFELQEGPFRGISNTMLSNTALTVYVILETARLRKVTSYTAVHYLV